MVCGFLSVLPLTCATNTSAALGEYSHRVWRIEDGLPQNRIRTIAQTPDGYLWVGTSEGLARFDGVRFTLYDPANTPALRDEGILVLRLASDGSLWIGTEGGGLVRYSHGEFRNFGPNEGLTNGFVRNIFEDRGKTLWVGTDRGFFRMDGNRLVRLDGTAEIPLATVGGISQDTSGRVWAASSAGLLSVVNGILIHAPSPCGTASFRMLKAASGAFLWGLNNNGASRIENGCATPDPLLPAIPMRTLTEDRDGTLWAGTVGHGLIRYRDGQTSWFTASAGLPDNTVNAVFEDLAGNLWVGCEDGLLRLSRSSVTNVGKAEGLDDDNVLTVSTDRNGALWMATLTGQVYRSQGSNLTRIRLPPAAANLQIRNVYQDMAGTYWFGTMSAGLVRLKQGIATVFTKQNGLRSNTVRQLLEDRIGNLWIALESGISRWDGAAFRNYYLEDGLSYPSTRCMISDNRGDILVGTDAGLNRIHDGAIVRDAEFAALSKEKIFALHQDSKGALWLGTRGGGLLRFRAGELSRFTRENGLPGNTIFQLLEDSARRLWMSTSSGVVSIDASELESPDPRALHIRQYGTADGMNTSQMNGGVQPAGVMTSSGDFWFPSVKGAVRIQPSEAQHTVRSPVLIERIVADNRSVPLGEPVSIPPLHGRLQFDFTQCDLLTPERVALRYKLEGFDENWTPAPRTRSVTYTNLAPGHYRFRVAASDSAPEAVLLFTLRPWFYQTNWFYALLALTVAAVVWSGFAFYAHQTRARYAVLLNERTRLAREMHDTVIQGCVKVSTLLEAVAGYRKVGSPEADKLLDQARVQVTGTLEEARQAVWDLRHSPAAESSIAILFDLARSLGEEHNIDMQTKMSGGSVPGTETGTHHSACRARSFAQFSCPRQPDSDIRLCDGRTRLRQARSDRRWLRFSPTRSGTARVPAFWNSRYAGKSGSRRRNLCSGHQRRRRNQNRGQTATQRLEFYNPAAQSCYRSRCPITDVQPRQHDVDMPLNRGLRNPQFLADPFIAHAFHDQLQHLQLTRTEFGIGGRLATCPAPVAAHSAAPCEHCGSPPAVRGSASLSEDIPARRPSGLGDVLIALVRGEDDHTRGREFFSDRAHCFDSAHDRHTQIDKRHIGHQFTKHFHQSFAVRRFAATVMPGSA